MSDLVKVDFLDEKDKEHYQIALNLGAKPIAVGLSAQMYELFLEGYSCTQIQKAHPSFAVSDIVYARVRNNWDESKNKYAEDLQKQVQEKLIKQKLESVEFLTNMVSVAHKEHNQQMLKYIQTGKEEDKPDTWIKSAQGYKNIIEIIQKITGEDKTSKVNINQKTESVIKLQGDTASQQIIQEILKPENAAKALKMLNNPEE